MIITNLIGGLGNQLFQYAAGYAVARQLNADLRICTDMFDGFRLHNGFELTRVFAINPPNATEADLRDCLGPWRNPLVRKLIGRYTSGIWRNKRAFFQPDPPKWVDVPLLESPVYLQGNWQSEHFFASVANELRSTFVFRSRPSEVNSDWMERIESCISVSMHVRRGDYTSVKNTHIYSQCTADYYSAAMDYIIAREPSARFFVFSDDPVWARSLFANSHRPVEIVDHNRGDESYNDMRLMSHCYHSVLANSTFSWWAAWLGERPGKIVIAPARWYLRPEMEINLIPPRWVRI